MQYKVKIRLGIAGALGGELTAELPFTLTHPKPADDENNSPRIDAAQVLRRPATAATAANTGDGLDMDLIQLDTV